jgi:hypothetical protein
MNGSAEAHVVGQMDALEAGSAVEGISADGITVVIASSGRPRTGFEMLQVLNSVPVYRRHHSKQA